MGYALLIVQELAYTPRLEHSLCIYNTLVRLETRYGIRRQFPD